MIFFGKSIKTVLAAALFAIAGSAASAATVDLYGASVGSPPEYDADALRGTIDCSACSGWTTLDTWDIYGDMHSGPSSADPADEAVWVNGELGTSFDETAAGASLNIDGTGSDMTFTSSALYILVKLGMDPEYFLIRNDLGAPQTYTWTMVGRGGGLSHYVEYGSVPHVPLPAAGFLLLGAIGGLGFVKRRRKSA